MNIMLIKLAGINSYSDWYESIIKKLGLLPKVNADLLKQLQVRDRLGSVQIAEHVVMPHVVSDQLPKSWMIISQLDKPIKYATDDDITTGIYIFSRPKDSSISKLIDRLTDESVIEALQNPTLSYQQLVDLFKR